MTSTNYDPRILKAPHPVPGAPDNWKRFFSFNTDAKVIGIQYIATSLLFLLVSRIDMYQRKSSSVFPMNTKKTIKNAVNSFELEYHHMM